MNDWVLVALRLHRLPVTMDELVDGSPFISDDGTMYIADKVTQ